MTYSIKLYILHLYLEKKELRLKHIRRLVEFTEDFSQELDNSKLVKDISELSKDELKDQDILKVSNIAKKILEESFSKTNVRLRRKKRNKGGMGLSVLLLGTDGTGKSTLVEGVANSLPFKSDKLYFGTGEEGWVYPAAKKLNFCKGGKVISCLNKVLSLPLELITRKLLKVKNGKYKVILIDRVPGWAVLDRRLNLIYHRILPRIDIVFFLTGDSKVLATRKSERSYESTIKEDAKFRKVAEKLSSGKYIELDTTKLSINECENRIINEIVSHPKLKINILRTLRR